MIKVQEGQKSKCNQPLSAPLTSPLGGQNSQTSFHCGQLKHLHVPDRLVIGGFVHLDEALKKGSEASSRSGSLRTCCARRELFKRQLRAGGLLGNNVCLLQRKANPLGTWMNEIAQKLMLGIFHFLQSEIYQS